MTKTDKEKLQDYYSTGGCLHEWHLIQELQDRKYYQCQKYFTKAVIFKN